MALDWTRLPNAGWLKSPKTRSRKFIGRHAGLEKGEKEERERRKKTEITSSLGLTNSTLSRRIDTISYELILGMKEERTLPNSGTRQAVNNNGPIRISTYLWRVANWMF